MIKARPQKGQASNLKTRRIPANMDKNIQEIAEMISREKTVKTVASPCSSPAVTENKIRQINRQTNMPIPASSKSKNLRTLYLFPENKSWRGRHLLALANYS